MRRKVLISGFSGAGKSTLLLALKNSGHSDWDYLDLDQVILRNYGKKHSDLSSLIEEVGWDKFRLWERQSFESEIKTEEKTIISLGGGTLSPLLWELYGSSRSLLFCHLSVPFELAWKRIVNDDKNSRPLVKSGELELKKVYEKRMEIFRQIPWQLDGSLPINNLTQLFWEKLS